MRAGTYALSLLSTPGVSSVLRALEREPMPLAELRRAVGSPPQTTMRVQLRELTALGVLARAREHAFPRSVSYEMTDAGRELLVVADALERWLDRDAPEPMRLGDTQARRAIKALADGWDAGIIGMLAAEPHSLTQLSREISTLSYPSLERRLTALRATGLVETLESNGRGAPCQPTAWLRDAVGALAVASRFESTHVAGGQETTVDVRALLMLALPTIQLAEPTDGTVTFATRQMPHNENGEQPALEGLTVQFRAGQPRRVIPAPEKAADAWALGTPSEWLKALLDGEAAGLRVGGLNAELAKSTIAALHPGVAGLRESRAVQRQPAAAR